MAKLIKERNGIYYIDYRAAGKRHKHSLRTKNKELAKQIFEDLLTRHTLGILGIAPTANPPLSDVFTEYLVYCKGNRSPRTYKDSKLHVDKFLMPVLGNIRASDLTDKHVETLITQMKQKTEINDKGKVVPAPYHPRTINLRLETLRKILRRAVETKQIEKMTVTIKLLPCPQTLPRYVTPGDLKKWLKHLNPEYRLRAELSVNTGISDKDITTLLWADYDAHESMIILHRAKTDRDNVIPLNARARAILEKLRKHAKGPYIFPDVQSMRKAYIKASRLSGVKVTPHMLRHNFATGLPSRGVPLAHVSALLGHQEQSTTQIYARVLPDYLRAAVATLDTHRANNGRRMGGGNRQDLKSDRK